jgi:hypothetical protein
MKWTRLNDSSRKRKAECIGAQKIEFETEDVCSVDVMPTITKGAWLAAVGIPPSSRKAAFSGIGSVWVDVLNECFVWVVAFNGEKMVGVVAARLVPGHPQTLSLTFTDNPGSSEEQGYQLRLYTDNAGVVFVNQCDRFNFEAKSSTAFIVEENLN